MLLQKEQQTAIENFGEKVGYIASYLIFTTISFYILTFSKSIPYSWSYIHIMVLVALIALTGTALKRLLK